MARDRVLVMGGTGFIGRVLVERLRAGDCEVRVLTRKSGLVGEGVEYVQGDVADRASIERAVDGREIVYDLSLGGGPTWGDFKRDLVDGARTVGEVCLRAGVRRLLYTSTIAGLHLAKEGSIDESTGADGRPELRSWYPRGKIYAERELAALHREQQLPVVIFRPGIVVGRGNRLSHPGVGSWRSPTVCTVVGPGTSQLPLVLVEDVAEALFLAKDVPAIDGRIFNLVGDVRPSAAEYVQLAAERSYRRILLETQSVLGLYAFHLAVWLGKTALRRQDKLWPSWHEMGNLPQRTHLDCSAAKQLLGWQPVADRDEFVRRAIDLHLTPPKPGDLRLRGA